MTLTHIQHIDSLLDITIVDVAGSKAPPPDVLVAFVCPSIVHSLG